MTTKNTWYAVDVQVAPEAIDATEHALNELGSLGTEMDSLRKRLDQDQLITGFFDQLPGEDLIRSEISASLAIHAIDDAALKNVSTRIVEETDWLAEWKKHWRPQTVGTFVIAPPWSETADSEKIVITIEPNMAFGTGTHETTQLCLESVSERYSGEMSFLDVGTGTGILAIAAAKLGGSDIFACDTDLDSVTIARENAEKNGVGDRIVFHHGPLPLDAAVHDFTCANLTLDVILPILDQLIAKTHRTLVLSGVLHEQQQEITGALSSRHIDRYQVRQSGDWISVTLELS